MLIKICGITRAEDAQQAIARGATALGFVFWPSSPRAITIEAAAAIVRDVPVDVLTVGVFVNERPDVLGRTVDEVGLRAVQLHGDEGVEAAAAVPVPLFRAVTLDGIDAALDAWPAATRFLLDAADPIRRGGTGMRVDWTRAAHVAARRPVVLAGGLTPENVAEAIAAVRPAGVDVSSGVEAAPGRKDHDKVALFVARARDAFRRLSAGAGAPVHGSAS